MKDDGAIVGIVGGLAMFVMFFTIFKMQGHATSYSWWWALVPVFIICMIIRAERR